MNIFPHSVHGLVCLTASSTKGWLPGLKILTNLVLILFFTWFQLSLAIFSDIRLDIDQWESRSADGHCFLFKGGLGVFICKLRQLRILPKQNNGILLYFPLSVSVCLLCLVLTLVIFPCHFAVIYKLYHRNTILLLQIYMTKLSSVNYLECIATFCKR